MFASIYDVLMNDVDYEALLEQFKPYINHSQTIIDAGCGTGYFLTELLRAGYDAIGLDKDSDMLKIAKNKLQEAVLPQPLYEHDLKDALGVRVDVVFCLFDVINYFKGVKTVFQNIYQALNDHGVLIFDIYQKDVMRTYHDYKESDTQPISYHWHIQYKPPILKHTVEVDQTIYQTKQYVYDLNYYIDMLKKTQFKDIKTHEGLDPRKTYIVAYK